MVDGVHLQSRLGIVLVAVGICGASCSTRAPGVAPRNARPPSRLDTTADCVGIVPDTSGDAFSFDVPPPPWGAVTQCDSATSDESGNIAASSGNNGSWELFSPYGDFLAHLSAQTLFPKGRDTRASTSRRR